ncbi:hypothetical protein ACHAQA_002231 [Verticillium albo-atrum]
MYIAEDLETWLTKPGVRLLNAGTMAPSKPEPIRAPLIWSENRQALCDALWYFKQHQAAAYPVDGVLRGFLLDGVPTARDMITPDVIITTLGGGRVMDRESGDMIRVKETANAAINACRRAFEKQEPVAVIVGKYHLIPCVIRVTFGSYSSGNKCPLVSVQLPHRYNVIDWFTVTDMWVEKLRATDKVFLWKIRLERTCRTRPSWCQTLHEATISIQPHPFPGVRADCKTCLVSSPQWFKEGWACLNANCESAFPYRDFTYAGDHACEIAWCIACKRPSKTIFKQGWTCGYRECENAFKFPTGTDVRYLAYTENFINQRTAFHVSPIDIVPGLPDPNYGSGTEKQARVGMVCPHCGGCSRRIHWNSWSYENPDCNFVLPAVPRPYTVENIYRERRLLSKHKKRLRTLTDVSVQKSNTTDWCHKVDTFFLPDLDNPGKCCGTVTVYRPTGPTGQPLLSGEHFANTLWTEMQTAIANGLEFKRNPVKCAGTSSEILTRNFQRNFGAPYKFVVNVMSTPFGNAPPFILQCLRRLGWAAKDAVTRGITEIPKQSLVKSPLMSDDFTLFNELLAIGYMEDDAISYHDDGEDTLGPTIATLSLGSSSNMHFARKKKYSRSGTVYFEVLNLHLQHGDMVVMHGAQIQQQYDHRVEPHGVRRFALTCRTINIDKLPEDEQAEAASNGKLPDRPEGLDYWTTYN